MLLGHLDYGMGAIRSFEKALEMLDLELKALTGPGAAHDSDVMHKRRTTKRKLAEVLTSIAKVYLTDCFMECDAHRVCEDLLDQALQHDADNPECTQALADLRLSQGRRGEALLMVRRTMELCANLDDGLAPSYDFRCVTARLLVELSEYELAEKVLVELLGEDDQDTEVWYLLGLCYLLCNLPSKCREALSEAKSLLERARSTDTALMGQINSLLERRSITEEEKHIFWNPRWWISGDGTAKPQNAEGEARLRQASAAATAYEASVQMVPSPTKGQFQPIMEEPADERMLSAL